MSSLEKFDKHETLSNIIPHVSLETTSETHALISQ